MDIEFPWFPKELNPNGRAYWRKKNPIKAEYREQCALIASQHKTNHNGKFVCTIIFHPPTRHNRDLDNCLAAVKSALDGMCSSLGINDKNLRPIILDFGEVIQGGMVKVQLAPL